MVYLAMLLFYVPPTHPCVPEEEVKYENFKSSIILNVISFYNSSQERGFISSQDFSVFNWGY